ncbi:MAG: hypothetical protein IJ744_05970 [Lachnospiraceae bacterium]|nr:hypothetical protein [Lachnospiraceae bacterium]
MKKIWSIIICITLLVTLFSPASMVAAETNDTNDYSVVSSMTQTNNGDIIRTILYNDGSELIVRRYSSGLIELEVYEQGVFQFKEQKYMWVFNATETIGDHTRSSTFIKNYTKKWNSTANVFLSYSAAALVVVLSGYMMGFENLPDAQQELMMNTLRDYAQSISGYSNMYFKSVNSEYLISDGAVSFYRTYDYTYRFASSAYSGSGVFMGSYTLDWAYPW